MQMDASAIKIPAGKTTFAGVAFINIGCPAGWKSPFTPDYVYGHISDVPLTYNFEAGKIYSVDFGSSIEFEEYEEEGHNMYFYIYEGDIYYVYGTDRPPVLAKIPINIELSLPEEWKR
ncbi:hypothetical protein FACS1894130_02720 [Spirochaetia bacterium]|nr:hypothetical protein FACS1894130_02720 [Spirochaetia bacterium]